MTISITVGIAALIFIASVVRAAMTGEWKGASYIMLAAIGFALIFGRVEL